MDHDLKYLFELLDDENEQSASMAMAELIVRDTHQLDTMLRKLQESSNPRLRRRIHQLQSALGSRRRRRLFSRSMETLNTDLIAGLTELHLMWFDNDLADTVYKQWSDHLDESMRYELKNLDHLAYFMSKRGYVTSPRDEMEAEYFCFGLILDELLGSDLILSVIVAITGAHQGLELCVVRINSDFGVMNRAGDVLFPGNDWKVSRREVSFDHVDPARVRVWNAPAILRMVGAQLFSCAVASDSFRYIYTIGTSLAHSANGDELDFLPYPYDTKRRHLR